MSHVLFEGGIQNCCMNTSLDADVSHSILSHRDLDL